MSINDKDLPPSILLLAHFINLALLSSALPEEGDVDDDDDDDEDEDKPLLMASANTFCKFGCELLLFLLLF
tara:strand:- start:28 stop:240 length:213 start_codon:yes stop_codon:yes gene_type:complete